jgi:CSLREA domain-containing protein
MQRYFRAGWALGLLFGTAHALAATISVDIIADEDNGNPAGGPNPPSTGCSLREAIQAVANNNGMPYNGCTAATAGGPNTIDIGVAGTIVVNSLVPDPSQPIGAANIQNGSLPSAMDATTHGTLEITNSAGATVSCDAGGKIIFTEASNADLTLRNLVIANCTADGGGIAISNVGGGNLTVDTVTFTNIKSRTGGNGAAIAHSNGNLVIDHSSFTGCSTDDGAGLGDGGAIWLGQVTTPQTVTINDTTFTNNTAAENGGAIYWVAADSLGHTIQMTNLTFTGNVAKGDSSNTPEYGGGAIWSKNSSSSGEPLWLIANTVFNDNHAPNGVGGAIAMSSNATLSYPAAATPHAGGVVASHFESNSAGGAASVDLRGGSGGAIYFHGDAMTIVESSFVNNASTHGSGGAIADFSPNPDTTRPTTFANTTFFGNTADQNGGAIANIRDGGQITLLNDTIFANAANGTGGNPGGGAIFNLDTNAGNVKVANTILSSSTGVGGNCAYSASGVPITDLAGNLQFSPNTGCGNMTASDPLLTPPAVLGGGPNAFVQVMDLGAVSPASGGGDAATCAAAPVSGFDATGRASIRPSGRPVCDIGAYESAELSPVELQSFEVD